MLRASRFPISRTRTIRSFASESSIIMDALTAKQSAFVWTAVGASVGLFAARYLGATGVAPVAPVAANSSDREQLCSKCHGAMSGSDDDSDDDLSEASSYEDDGDFGLEDSTVVPPDVELKMVVCVRQDLNMSKGKIAAQVGHAVLACYRIACKTTPEFVKAWLYRAQAKITLKVDNEKDMDAIAAAARAAGIAVCAIEDAGRTEVEPGTRTVLGIGPAPKADIDKITGPKGKFPLRLLA